MTLSVNAKKIVEGVQGLVRDLETFGVTSATTGAARPKGDDLLGTIRGIIGEYGETDPRTAVGLIRHLTKEAT